MTELSEPTDSSNDTLQTLWQEDNQEILPMLLDDVHKRARRYLFRSDIDFYGGTICVALIVLLSGVSIMEVGDGVLRLGYFLTVLGSLLLIYLYKTFRPVNRKAIASASLDCLDFYKRSLKKRIRLAQTAWAWMLLPILPGPVLCLYRFNQILTVAHPGAQITIQTARNVVLVAESALTLLVVGLLIYWTWCVHARTKELKALEAISGNEH